jgi:hypothetical protein
LVSDADDDPISGGVINKEGLQSGSGVGGRAVLREFQHRKVIVGCRSVQQDAEIRSGHTS